MKEERKEVTRKYWSEYPVGSTGDLALDHAMGLTAHHFEGIIYNDGSVGRSEIQPYDTIVCEDGVPINIPKELEIKTIKKKKGD